jgi:hypothetical protein
LRARDFAEALAINRQCTGRGISKQSWLIAPKIRAVDDLLQADCRLRGVLRESHPEICFWALNDAKPMRHNKKTQEGRDERMALLLKSFPAADSLLEEAMTRYRRKEERPTRRRLLPEPARRSGAGRRRSGDGDGLLCAVAGFGPSEWGLGGSQDPVSGRNWG